MSYLILRNHYSTTKHVARTFTQQYHLGTALEQLFPGHYVRENVRKEGSIRFPSTSNFLEMDFWIPDLHIAFEFQDIHHYKNESLVQKSLDYVNARDDFKKDMLLDRGETLVHVPYWWDGSISSLAATIRLQREDLLPESTIGNPIPTQPPFLNHLKGIIPDVGELMLAGVPDAPILNPEKWWVSEKYDGIRGCWNPRTNTIYTRSGGEIIVPYFLTKNMPDGAFIDLEFWSGRGSFDEVSKVVYFAIRLKPREIFDYSPEERDELAEKSQEMSEWNFLRVLVVDCPDPALVELPFEARLRHVLDCVDKSHPFVAFIPHMASKGRKFLTKNLEDMLKEGGEGIVLRSFNSPYSAGRSDMLYKLKMIRDEEALLVSVDDKQNLYTLQFPAGYLVTAAIPPNFETSNVKPGDILTVRTDNYSENVPVKVVVIRVRMDLTWHDVVANYKVRPPTKLDILGNDGHPGLKEPIATRKPPGYWQIDNEKNVKLKFDEFAKKRGLDPLVPETWYDISREDLVEGNIRFLHHYNKSYTRALASIYPNIGLKMARFKRKPGSFWTSMENQRAYLDDYAARNGFDPLVPKNWKDFSASKLRKYNGYSLIQQYNCSPYLALRSVYPDVNFQPDDLHKNPKNHWKSKENKRKAFDKFAASRGFDPLIPENWYSLLYSEAVHDGDSEIQLPLYGKGGRCLQTVLPGVYPEVAFSPLKFVRLRQHYWKNTENLKGFLLDVATKNNFDPLLPEQWLLWGYKSISKEQHGYSLLSLFGSVARVIQAAFPEMGITNVKTKVKMEVREKRKQKRESELRRKASSAKD